MVIAIAELRRTARVLQSEGRCTVAALAKRLGKKPSEVSRYINRISGLAAELAVQSHEPRRDAYRQAIDRLLNAGVCVTRRRVAFLAGANERATKGWLNRHPDDAKLVLSQREARHRRLMARAEWLCRTAGVRSVTALAIELDIERESLHRLLRKYPGLRSRLGM